MNSASLFIVLLLSTLRCIPHALVMLFHRNKSLVYADTRRWLQLQNSNIKNPLFGFLYVMTFYQQFRNLFYCRVKTGHLLLNFLCPQMSTLTIACPEIGEGLFLPHGYSTAIGAASIGKNCSINHNVTIGTYGNDSRPVLMDNVRINAGAVVFGNITIGNNVVIGANATVNTSIPDNSTVFPPSSRVVKWSPGIKTEN